MIPLYGFLEGDTIGLVVLAQPGDTAADLCARLISAAAVRVGPPAQPRLVLRGRIIPSDVTVEALGLVPLERIDVRGGGGEVA